METQKIMENYPVGWIMVGSLLLYMIGIPYWMATGANEGFSWGMFIIVFIVVSVSYPLYHILSTAIISSIMAGIITGNARKKFADYIGGEPKFFDVSVSNSKEGCSGAGIAYNNGYIYLMEGGVAAKYPWADIRSWSWKVEGKQKTKIYGSGAAARVARTQATLDDFHENGNLQAMSGFFVEVADIEKPHWHFCSTDKDLLRRWHEIFNQINDGKLAPPTLTRATNNNGNMACQKCGEHYEANSVFCQFCGQKL